MNSRLASAGLTVRNLVMENTAIRSQRYSVTKVEDGVTTTLKDTAIQARLQAGSPRQVYQKVKAYVSSLRGVQQ